MNRKQQAAEMRSTWMVMREPKNLDGNRKARRARLAQARADARANEKRKDLRVGDSVTHLDDPASGLGRIITRNPDGSWQVKWDDPRSDVTSFPSRLLIRARAVSASAAEGAVSAGSQEPQADRASPSAADSEVA